MPVNARTLYKKLLTLYPQAFREQLGESMEQTFNDLYNERKQQTERGTHIFILWIFIDTGMGIIKEHILLMTKRESMKNILSRPGTAAITSSILSLPLGFLFIIFKFDIEPLTAPVKFLLTVNGSDVNGLGHIALIGGLFLLPAAFVINLLPMLKKDSEGKRISHTVNLIVGVMIILLIMVSWGGLLVEQIYCLQGIRCD